jgi:hypothetical protein
MKIYADKWEEYAAIVRAWMGEDEEGLQEEEYEMLAMLETVDQDEGEPAFAVAWRQNQVNHQ